MRDYLASMSKKEMKKDRLTELYSRYFQPLPDAVRGGDHRAFKIFYGWEIAPPPPGIRVKTVTSTRSEELAGSP